MREIEAQPPDEWQCPRCNVVCQLHSRHVTYNEYWPGRNAAQKQIQDIYVTTCVGCKYESIWIRDKMVYPPASSAPNPSKDCPAEVLVLFEEARAISIYSRRAAAAMMRLCLEQLLKSRGYNGKLFKMIGDLVKDGVPRTIVEACDVVRHFGNENVHPGTINLEENDVSVDVLFDLVNRIIDHLITQPAQHAELFSKLPETVRESIQRRDDTE